MENRSQKRKKKRKNEIVKAKRYGKLGWFGRGSHVDEDTYQYFLRIHELHVEKYDNDEEKATAAANALEQTINKEVDLVKNQFISRVIENLLPFASDENIERFINAFTDLRILCTDNFSSHVVQTLLKVCAKRYKENSKPIFQSFVLKTSSFVFNNLEDFIYDSYANHIGRTCLVECSGSSEHEGLSHQLVENLGNRIKKWPELKDLPNNALTSGFLQTFLTCLSQINYKIAKSIIKKLLDENYFLNCEDGKKSDEIPLIFSDMPRTRLLETIIEVSKGKYLTQIYLHIFKDRLKILSCDKSSYIAVQKLISSDLDPSEFSSILDELIPSFSDVIKSGQIGVLLSLAKTCVKFGTKEGEFLKALKVALAVENSCRGELITKIIYKPEENGVKKIDLNGSLLVQTLFQFKKPITVVESFLALDTKILKEILTDPRGSHIADAFVASNTIGEKSRDRLIHALKGHYKELAMDKFGSRVLDALWSKSTLKEKHILMGGLSRSITTTLYGSIVAQKYKLDSYLADKTKWAAQLSSTSPDKLFADILKK